MMPDSQRIINNLACILRDIFLIIDDLSTQSIKNDLRFH